jgi:hypothetical protein
VSTEYKDQIDVATQAFKAVLIEMSSGEGPFVKWQGSTPEVFTKHAALRLIAKVSGTDMAVYPSIKFEEDIPDDDLEDVRGPRALMREYPHLSELSACQILAYKEQARKLLYAQVDRFILEGSSYIDEGVFVGMTDREIDEFYTEWRTGVDGM